MQHFYLHTKRCVHAYGVGEMMNSTRTRMKKFKVLVKKKLSKFTHIVLTWDEQRKISISSFIESDKIFRRAKEINANQS